MELEIVHVYVYAHISIIPKPESSGDKVIKTKKVGYQAQELTDKI